MRIYTDSCKVLELDLKTAVICLIIMFFAPLRGVAQVSEGGLPPSFSYQQTLRSAIMTTIVPVDFYIEDLRVTDNWRAREGTPMPVGQLISVDYTMENAGHRTVLPGGENIWRLSLKAAGAVAMMLYYDDFYIPPGGKLFIYNADKSQVLGAYTQRTHPSGGLFATEFVGGDELILEYVESEISDEKPRIVIGEIGYGYNEAALRQFCNITTRKTAAPCMVNINCEEGNAWQNEKKGVCFTIQRIGMIDYMCSASLMNNTAEDFKPLILTANHCALGARSYATEAEMQQWLFYFHKEREECDNSSLPVVSKTLTGCRLLAATGMAGGSDGMLLLLNEMVPEDYDVFYNGWDRSGVAANSGVCIHHPQGDYKKISTYETPIISYTFQSTEFTGDSHAHWNATFKETPNGYGVTEDGSSGSPLFNENKLVIGTLTGGNSTCTYPHWLNIYGKLSYHWDRYKTDSSTRMDVWLDPLGKNVQTLSGRFHKILRSSPQELKVANLGNNISLTWKAPADDDDPIRYNIYRNNTKLEETTALFFLDEAPIEGSLVYSVSAVYENGEESAFAVVTISYVKYLPPSGLVAQRKGAMNNEVQLNWNAPLYEQTIFWGTTDKSYAIGYDDNPSFYYGQKWSVEEISPLHEKTITAIQFVPLSGNTYEVYISQGERSYKQAIKFSVSDSEDLYTVHLETPFVIDGTKSLIVSVYAATSRSGFPAVCDDGPVVDGKGNVVSFDGKEWGKLYKESSPGAYDYNFIVTAVVSSESGVLSAEQSNIVADRSAEIKISDFPVRPRISALSATMNELRSVSAQSSMPAAFPEVTKYRIYRSGSPHKEVSTSIQSYIDKTMMNSYYYEVTAIYDNIESEKSNRANIFTVGTDYLDTEIDIYPTRFSRIISLKGFDAVSRVEVFAVSGKRSLVVDHPDETIDTSSLSPGLYFFCITENNGRQKVVKAIKSR